MGYELSQSRSALAGRVWKTEWTGPQRVLGRHALGYWTVHSFRWETRGRGSLREGSVGVFWVGGEPGRKVFWERTVVGGTERVMG